MNTTQQLLERVRARTSTKSDYAVAKALGFSVQRMSNYMAGRNEIQDDDTIVMIATFLGDDPALTLASIRRERATSTQAKAAWQRLENLAKHAGLRGADAALIAA